MIMNYIENAEIGIDTINGDHFTVELSPTQLAIVCKILGFHFDSNGEMTCFSDTSLKQIIDMKGNPLRLQEKE